MIYVKSLFFHIMQKLEKIKYFGPSKALGLCLSMYQTSQGQCQACQNLSPAPAAGQQESVPHHSPAVGACRRCLLGPCRGTPRSHHHQSSSTGCPGLGWQLEVWEEGTWQRGGGVGREATGLAGWHLCSACSKVTSPTQPTGFRVFLGSWYCG